MHLVPLSAKVPADLDAELRRRARVSDRTRSSMVADAIRIYLSDTPAVRDAIDQLERVRQDPFALSGRLD